MGAPRAGWIAGGHGEGAAGFGRWWWVWSKGWAWGAPWERDESVLGVKWSRGMVEDGGPRRAELSGANGGAASFLCARVGSLVPFIGSVEEGKEVLGTQRVVWGRLVSRLGDSTPWQRTARSWRVGERAGMRGASSRRQGSGLGAKPGAAWSSLGLGMARGHPGGASRMREREQRKKREKGVSGKTVIRSKIKINSVN